MPKVTYEPRHQDDDGIVQHSGLVFEKGKAVDVPEDHPAFQKVAHNPQFRVQGTKEAKDVEERQKASEQTDKQLAKTVDQRTKHASKVGFNAQQAQAEADAAERDRQQAEALQKSRDLQKREASGDL